MTNPTLLQSASALLVVSLLFLSIVAFYLFGYRMRIREIQRNHGQPKVELSSMNGMLLGLLGLLLAFTFSMASSRYDTRRQVVILEVNAIGTAVLRTDIYPDSMRRLLRETLRKYLDERIAFYQAGTNEKEAGDHHRRADLLSREIWSTVARYAQKDNIITRTSELIPALNEMIDITTTRQAAAEATVPDSIMYLLFLLCGCSAFLLGYDNKFGIDWVLVIAFAFMLSLTVYTIIDLDRPSSGLINLDTPNQKMIELRELFDN